MRKRDCKVGVKVRVIGTATLRDFPKCVGTIARIDEISSDDPSWGSNSICCVFRRVVCHGHQKNLWLPPRDLEEVQEGDK